MINLNPVKTLKTNANCSFQKSRRFVVRAKGLEPPRRKAPDPKSGASASSAMPAKCGAKVVKFLNYEILNKTEDYIL